MNTQIIFTNRVGEAIQIVNRLNQHPDHVGMKVQMNKQPYGLSLELSRAALVPDESTDDFLTQLNERLIASLEVRLESL